MLGFEFSRDRRGPMCRTVEDTAAVLEVLTGDDPRDAITAVAHGRRCASPTRAVPLTPKGGPPALPGWQ
jgi:Asp-tRNA(Asn)/Glu-tRNA(Gln) amidotransferase A subunit family amidase